ncbi:MAG: DUF3107 domain-containing protein [Actinomycetaceae bacterium]|nr:DUF3107 domain-containing protein [Actinomycetaceae bacterium]
MIIQIGISGIARELTLEVDMEEDALFNAVSEAVQNPSPLQLTDVKGRRLLIPAGQLGYVLAAEDKRRPVGFTVA